MSNKTVYSFDPASGAFMGAEIAWESPLEKGVYHMPPHTTEVAPPAAAAGTVAIWSGASWAVQPDLRGQAIYSTSTGAASTQAQVGALAAGFTLQKPATAQDKWGGSAWLSPPSANCDWNGTAWVLNPARQAAADLAAYKASAQAELDKSERTMNRIAEAVCLGLNHWTNADVVAWANYRRTLRTALSATVAGTLPARPPYAEGT